MLTRIARIAAVLVLIVCAAVLLSNEEAIARFNRELATAIVFAQFPLAVSAWAIAWRLTLLAPARALGIWAALRASLLAQGADLVLPWRLSEFVKLAYLGERAGIGIGNAVAAVALERITDAVIVGVLVVLAAVLMVTEVDIVAAGATAVALLFSLRVLPRLRSHIHRLIEAIPLVALRSLAKRSVDAAVARVEDGSVWRALLPGLLAWASSLAATGLFLAVVGQGASTSIPSDLVVVLSLSLAITLGNAFALLPASVGTYEAAVVLVLGAYGVPVAQSLPLAIALHGAHLLLGALGAALVAMTEPLGVKALARRAMDLASKREAARD
jgi:hypothetical protein